MNPGSVLVLEKTFVRPFSGVVRGVESFNLRLVRDMAAAGWRVCAPADGTWAGPLGEAARAAASRGGGAGPLAPRAGGGDPLEAGGATTHGAAPRRCAAALSSGRSAARKTS